MSLNEFLQNERGNLLWQPHSWKNFEASQQPDWGSTEALASAIAELERLPGLVGAGEIESLKSLIGEASLGRRFILQGGDCAERFQDCQEDIIRGKVLLLMQMSLILGYSGSKSVVPIGRMAGQYAKPRSQDFEESLSGKTLPIFRGESINSFDAVESNRKPDPARLLQAYHTSSATLNFIRMLMASGFGDLRDIGSSCLTAQRTGAYGKRFEQIATELRNALAFIEQDSGVSGEVQSRRRLARDFFVSHEALLLPYEEALTRFVPEMGRYYNLSAHFVWIGDRTRSLAGAHVEYCRGIGNPIGIKVSSDVNIAELLEIIERVNPHQEPGKVTLITRLGANNVQRCLPPLVQAVRASLLPVTWMVDPMHGNTVRTIQGLKTRRFEDVVGEMQQSHDVHNREGTHLGGIHLEMTDGDVTECTGGTIGLRDSDLGSCYETWCDPRLNGRKVWNLLF